MPDLEGKMPHFDPTDDEAVFEPPLLRMYDPATGEVTPRTPSNESIRKRGRYALHKIVDWGPARHREYIESRVVTIPLV